MSILLASKMMVTSQTLTMMPVILPTSPFIAPSDKKIPGPFSDHNPRKRVRTNQSNTDLSEHERPEEPQVSCASWPARSEATAHHC